MEIENLIFKIVRTIPELSVNDKDEIFEMLKHNEWGIAFEIICNALECGNIIIKSDTYSLIEEAGRQMNMPACVYKNISRAQK